MFPVFLKLDQLRVLLIGAGKVGTEKLSAILNNSPQTKVTVIAKEIADEFQQKFLINSSVRILQKPYEQSDLGDFDIVFVAVGNIDLATEIYNDAYEKNILINVADKPSLCDFYLSSIAQKGSIKIAISTNGKSPTMAKRLKEIIQQSLPNDLEDAVDNLDKLRKNFDGDFHSKVEKLNAVTQMLIQPVQKSIQKKPWYLQKTFYKKIVFYASAFIVAMLFSYWLFGYLLPVGLINHSFEYLCSKIDRNFIFMFIAGFFAQLVDGAMGMGYGVLSTTFLLSTNLSVPAISSSVHMAEMFSVGTAGISHYKYKHVNKKLWLALVVPGVVGAILGAIFIGTMGKTFGNYLRPFVAGYTFYLGFRILKKAFKSAGAQRKRKITNVRPVAVLGGFLDAFGGGWGPLVTSTLISGGRDPLYTIGSSTFTKFFTSIASTATFVIVFGQMHFQIIAGLIIGGILAAPIAAKLAGKIPHKTMFVCVGLLVILCSVRVILNIFF